MKREFIPLNQLKPRKDSRYFGVSFSQSDLQENQYSVFTIASAG